MAKRKAKPKAEPVAPVAATPEPIYTKASLEDRVTSLEERFETLKVALVKKRRIENI